MVHSVSHHRFHLVLEIGGRQSGAGILRRQRPQQRGKTSVRILAVCRGWLAKHFAQHVHNPGALRIDHHVVAVGRARRTEPRASNDGSDLSRRAILPF